MPSFLTVAWQLIRDGVDFAPTFSTKRVAFLHGSSPWVNFLLKYTVTFHIGYANMSTVFVVPEQNTTR